MGNLLESRALHVQLRRHNDLLEETVRNRTAELEQRSAASSSPSATVALPRRRRSIAWRSPPSSATTRPPATSRG
jgi:hypothetical protein